MHCPFCQHPDNRVLESRSAESGRSIRRRRECLRCERRFTTYERIEYVPVTVIKRSQEHELFNRSKLLRGIVRACEKTTVSPQVMEGIVDDIEAELQQRHHREVTSAEIGEMVLVKLRAVNEVAFVRFASVYRQFQGIRDFADTLNQLRDGQQQDGQQQDGQQQDGQQQDGPQEDPLNIAEPGLGNGRARSYPVSTLTP